MDDEVGITNVIQRRKHMMYIEMNQPHYLVWPALAFGRNDTEGFWIGIGWLNKEIGWKSAKEKTHD